MPQVRLGEETVRLYNPLPRVTVREIIEEAGLQGLRRADDSQQFRFEYKWSTGVEREDMSLDPGEVMLVPISLAEVIVRHHGVLGILYIRDKTSAQRQFEQIIEALHKALSNYQALGSLPLGRFIQRHSYDPEKDLNVIKAQVPGKYANTFKEKRIQKLIDRLVKDGIDSRVMVPEKKAVGA